MRVLVVKTSSMGDVVHTLPAVTDLLRHHPDAEVDWVLESAFAAIPALHPGVRRVIPIAWRKWRRALGRRSTWQAMAQARRALREQRYDAVIDLQGMVKSVLWGVQANGPLMGFDRRSVRERLAAWCYTRVAEVPKAMHAVQRSRLLMARLLDDPPPEGPPDFGLRAPPPSWPAPPRAVVLIPNASRPEKFWPQACWIAVGQRLLAQGLCPVVLWGSPAEQAMASHIAQGCGGVVPPFLKVGEMAAVLAGAELIVGLDTGFTHLGAAFGRPVVGIYCDHEPGLTGLTGAGPRRSIGGCGQVPALEAVQALIDEVRAEAASRVPAAR